MIFLLPRGFTPPVDSENPRGAGLPTVTLVCLFVTSGEENMAQAWFGGISVQRGADSEVGRYVVAGEVNGLSAPPVLADNHDWVTQTGVASQVVCYRGSRIAVDAAALLESVRGVVGAQRAGGLLVPTALVVTPDTMPLWRGYTWLMAQAGVMRAAFTCEAAARRWAVEQAALWAAQRRHRSPWQLPR